MKHICKKCGTPTRPGTDKVCKGKTPCRVCPNCGEIYVKKPGSCSDC